MSLYTYEEEIYLAQRTNTLVVVLLLPVCKYVPCSQANHPVKLGDVLIPSPCNVV